MDKGIAAQSKELMNYVRSKDGTWLATVILTITIVVTVIAMFSYITGKLRLQRVNCQKMDNRYGLYPSQTVKTLDTSLEKYKLHDFYIKTAYNCCSGGQFRNSFVDLCHLKTAIRQGCRVLDFEIYSVDNEPVIATSSNPMVLDNKINQMGFTFKETYNQIPLGEALSIVNRMAFSGDCPNQDDLLILHFRIKSTNRDIYSKIANKINQTLSGYLLPQEYGNENGGENITSKSIGDLKSSGRVIICVDKTNPMYVDTPLFNYVNMATNSSTVRKYNAFEIKDIANFEELTNFNKVNMSMVTPNVGTNNTNPPFNMAFSYGCQMIGMNLSNNDGNLQLFEETFKSSAFVLKDASLRKQFVEVAPPDPNLKHDIKCETYFDAITNTERNMCS